MKSIFNSICQLTTKINDNIFTNIRHPKKGLLIHFHRISRWTLQLSLSHPSRNVNLCAVSKTLHFLLFYHQLDLLFMLCRAETFWKESHRHEEECKMKRNRMKCKWGQKTFKKPFKEDLNFLFSIPENLFSPHRTLKCKLSSSAFLLYALLVKRLLLSPQFERQKVSHRQRRNLKVSFADDFWMVTSGEMRQKRNEGMDDLHSCARVLCLFRSNY